MHPIVNIASNAALAAGKLILQSLDKLSSINITEKSHHDFATSVDIKSEKIIINAIQHAYPDHQIIAEESGKLQGDVENTWVIDPLDGTTNFIHGFPHYCISIAFLHKNKISHAVIYDPIQDELFTASKGEGALLNNRKIRVSTTHKLGTSLIGTGFPFRQPDLFEHYLKTFTAIFPHTSGVRRTGSAALDLAYVAAGRLDGFWEFLLHPWDMAAGALLIKEAGGLVSDMAGSENYLENGNIVAGNPKIFKILLQQIRRSTETV